MSPSGVDSILIEGMRTAFLLIGPLVLAVALAGIITAVLQGVTLIHDPASAYAIRLITVVLVYFTLGGSFLESLRRLCELAFRGG